MLKRFFQQTATTSLEQFRDVSRLLEKQYKEQVAQRHIQFDEAQFMALKPLHPFWINYLRLLIMTSNQLPINYSPTVPQNVAVCILGGVGRGKTMLMDLFYEACPITQKRRVHFNAFVLEVHAFIHQWRQQNNTDAISALAKKSETQPCFCALMSFMSPI